MQRHLNSAATGRPDWDWLSRVRAEHLPRTVPRLLVLGCGSGYLERALVRDDAVGTVRILATDPRPEAVDLAARQAQQLGLSRIEYARLDPESEALPEGPWDLILAADFLHHVQDAERVLAAAGRGLAPRGRFVFHEYTGPNRFQHSAERLEIVRRYFPLLPDRVRADPSTGELLWRRDRLDPERLARELPFEAAASETLVPLARRILVPEAEMSGGEGLLHPLLSGLVYAYRGEDEPLFEVLCAAEEHLTATGQLAPLFTIFVGGPRGR